MCDFIQRADSQIGTEQSDRLILQRGHDRLPVLALVHDHTKGVARKINNLCRTALLLGATEKKPIFDETDLKRVIRDLEGQIG
jgi:hypothetical protein